ncbi:MAG TPA: hypothetical protein VFG42_17995 [Baekduia sp.]|uniref:hypothetical protein n=1 Tax=Baekduia sp. TaxID=2600305 RepID=UPI002D7A3537|nr:hypothetical protein [Baekduia sp.]HET6508691.1 hypothetical protein [Baekduia sp.]
MRVRTVPSSVLLACAIAAAAVPASAGAKSVHLTGTAYEFNNTSVRLAGAQVRVAEDPTLGATARQDGSYDLKVPDRRKITPYIIAAGHHTIYLQTFTTDGQDLAHVNFQVPSDAIYGALAALLQVPVDASGNPAQCAIVSTFSTRNVRTLAFDDFTAYGAHGVAGATATASPALPAPVYFNKDVIPDRSQPRSSKDGGVIWPVVPTGTYTITAHHASTRFASFVATCAPGRIVNANPPWGLHELGRANPTTLTVRAGVLHARGLPKGSTIALGSRTLLKSSTTSAKTIRLRTTARTFTITATAPTYDGVALRVANGRSTRLCVPLGETKPRKSCR